MTRANDSGPKIPLRTTILPFSGPSTVTRAVLARHSVGKSRIADTLAATNRWAIHGTKGACCWRHAGLLVTSLGMTLVLTSYHLNQDFHRRQKDS